MGLYSVEGAAQVLYELVFCLIILQIPKSSCCRSELQDDVILVCLQLCHWADISFVTRSLDLVECYFLRLGVLWPADRNPERVTVMHMMNCLGVAIH